MAGAKNGNGFDGHKWYLNMMHKRTKAALKKTEEAFIQEHRDDSDEELLNLIVERAKELK